MSSLRLRVCVHALDRTGPPVLALALLRWLAGAGAEVSAEVVAFRGGELLDDVLEVAPATVALAPREAWDAAAPDAARAAAIAARLGGLPSVDVTLLVSVSAGQLLPYLPVERSGAVVTWVVEQGQDLHWLDAPVGVRERTHRWLAGSQASLAELAADHGIEAALVPEFIPRPPAPSAEVRARRRASLGLGADDRLVLGAGIATHRKAPDLFVELALAHRRLGGDARFAWLGGEHDPFLGHVRAESDRLGADVAFVGNVVDVEPWCAAADVFAHPARTDAFPLVCLHAAGVGTPVVAFEGVGGVPEMFGPAFVGAPYPDLEALARRVDELLDASRGAVMGERQQARVVGEFVDDVAAPRLLAEVCAAGAAT